MRATGELTAAHLLANMLRVHTACFPTLMPSTFPLFIASSIANISVRLNKFLAGYLLL